MRKNSGEVGEGGEDNERADKGIESSRVTNVDTTHQGADNTTEHGGIERIFECRADLTKESGKWGGIIAGQRPEGTPSGNVASNAVDNGREESNDKQTGCTSIAASSLLVDCGKREADKSGIINSVKVRCSVEDGDEVCQGSDEAN